MAGAEAAGREGIGVLTLGEVRAVIAEHLIMLRTDEGDADGALDADG